MQLFCPDFNLKFAKFPFKDDQNDFKELQELAPVLQKIEETTSMTSIRKTANDLRVSILTRGAVEIQASSGTEDRKGTFLYFLASVPTCSFLIREVRTRVCTQASISCCIYLGEQKTVVFSLELNFSSLNLIWIF